MHLYDRRRFVLVVVALGVSLPTRAQELNENCVVSILNRTASVLPDGSWQIPNVPAGLGLVRVRATCVLEGLTVTGQSDFINIEANIVNGYSPFGPGQVDPVPTSVAVSADPAILTAEGQTTQLGVTATLPDDSSSDVTASRGVENTCAATAA